MLEQVKHVLTGITLSLLAYLKPIEGELWSLFLIFFLNFIFGYLADMIANGEEWNNKKALRCVGEATVFFILCNAVFALGRFKGQVEGSVQCVSFITYAVIYFYGTNVLRNCRHIFKENTPPWQVCSFLYYLLRFKFIERIPYIKEYLNLRDEKDGKENGNTVLDKDDF